jgi:hypothetical protein
MGDSGAPYAEVIGQIADLRLANDDARAFVSEGLDALRRADDKRHLSYALNEVMRASLDRRCSADVVALGREALLTAEALDSPTERIVATALLIEAARSDGTTGQHDGHLYYLRGLLVKKPIAPRGQAALQRLYDRCPGIATVVQTQPH